MARVDEERDEDDENVVRVVEESDEEDENIAGEVAGQEREDIGQAGGVDEERDEDDEDVVREVAGRDEDAGQDIEDIDSGRISVSGDRNHEWEEDVKGYEDNDIGVAPQTHKHAHMRPRRGRAGGPAPSLRFAEARSRLAGRALQRLDASGLGDQWETVPGSPWRRRPHQVGSGETVDLL